MVMSFEMAATLTGFALSAIFGLVGKLLWSKYSDLQMQIRELSEGSRQMQSTQTKTTTTIEYIKKDLEKHDNTTERMFELFESIQEQLSEIKQRLAASKI
jgi:hypothetical protein